MEKQTDLIPFKSEQIRKILYKDEWYFSVVDIIGVLTDSAIPRNYWSDLKRREKQLHEVCVQLKLPAADSKNYKTDCANTEGVLRIIMSVPSPKAEPMKLWLAQVGKERIAETGDPEISVHRLTELYKAKGYDDVWIGNRLKTIGIRKELTDEWKARGVKEGQEYAILTAEIAQQTFGLTPSEHAKLKGLDKQNLRDHMNNLELVLTAFGEEVTRRMAIKDDAQGFAENHEAAIKGGIIAGQARLNVEAQLGEKVVSAENFLGLAEKNDSLE
ncbi:MAG: Bro-N domain-containing protein [Saprospiraceae bacterium]|nr:Bro-N domain-containing protein [Saprospiraceae bacterium]